MRPCLNVDHNPESITGRALSKCHWKNGYTIFGLVAKLLWSLRLILSHSAGIRGTEFGGQYTQLPNHYLAQKTLPGGLNKTEALCQDAEAN
jgi:hypothetical protein